MSANLTIVGLGLIGGSLARSLRLNGFSGRITGVESNPHHRTIAMYRGLADEFLSLDEAVEQSDIIILCAPVDINCRLLPGILDMIGGTSKVVTDMGSTKADIASVAEKHPARGRYVSAHPMAGTENSGPAAALDRLFENKVAIICDAEQSDDDAMELITALLQSLNMRIQYMNSREHDVHVAYVSHISHINSFALALCVLDKEKDSRNIMSLAAGGFESTVRLSKSKAETWAPIFAGNSGPIIEVIDTYIEKMRLFRTHIKNGDSDALRQMMITANEIGNILK
jgi:prephenate dehydrogenase